MSFFSKIAFWKKTEERPSTGLGDLNLNMSGTSSPETGLKSPFDNPEFGKEQVSTQQGSSPFQEGTATLLRETAPNAPPGHQPQQSGQNYHAFAASKDMEVISAKLDALRAALESINQRLANLERIASGEQKDNKRWPY